MKNNILFIEPRGARANFFINSIHYPLLGPLYLATQLFELGYKVKVIKEIFVDESLLYEEMKKADILILTILTNCAYRAYSIAESYKRIRPDGRIIAGGIHTSLMPDEVLQYVDQVAIGEGSLVIEDMVNGKLKNKIINCPPLEDLNDRPIPNFSLFINSHKIKRIPIMTSLGCPFGCTFCCVTKMYGQRYRYQNPDKTIAELKNHFKQLGNKSVFFYDDNFCANKKISRELFRKIKENNLKFQWGCQLRADVAKDEDFVKVMADVGCNRVYIGFESINENTLIDLKKNETLLEIETAINIFHKYGIAVHGMFIFGTDCDGLDIFSNTINFCIERKVESAQFFTITPFPGTEYYKSIDKNRLSHKNYDILDGFHVNLVPKKMTEYELVKGVIDSHKKFYSWYRIIRQIFNDIIFILTNRNRPLLYKIQKSFRTLVRNIGFRIMIKKWKKNHKDYHQSLKDKHEEELKNKELKTAIPFKNYHISS